MPIHRALRRADLSAGALELLYRVAVVVDHGPSNRARQIALNIVGVHDEVLLAPILGMPLVLDDAEIAVKRIDAVKKDGSGAGAREGGGDFLADVAGFADANDDDFAARFESFGDAIDGGGEMSK